MWMMCWCCSRETNIININYVMSCELRWGIFLSEVLNDRPNCFASEGNSLRSQDVVEYVFGCIILYYFCDPLESRKSTDKAKWNCMQSLPQCFARIDDHPHRQNQFELQYM